MTHFIPLTIEKQFRLFTFGLALNMLGMVLTDAWVPMVVGAVITAYLSLEALIRLRYVTPLEQEIAALKAQLDETKSGS